LKDEPGDSAIGMSGSISVVRQLLAAGLLDELHLLVHPIAVRKGMRLFDEGEPPIPFALISSQTFKTGVLNLVYAPAGTAGNASYEDAKVHLPQTLDPVPGCQGSADGVLPGARACAPIAPMGAIGAHRTDAIPPDAHSNAARTDAPSDDADSSLCSQQDRTHRRTHTARDSSPRPPHPGQPVGRPHRRTRHRHCD
jgi:hypothetical protein